MDNLNSHKVAGVGEAIEARGAMLAYLPPYSPDFNPIELVFAKFKWLLRSNAARTKETLWESVRRTARPLPAERMRELLPPLRIPATLIHDAL